MTVLAFDTYTTNADLIEAAHQLGYINDDDWTLDPTWGLGRFWTGWRPTYLYGTDLNPDKSQWHNQSIDFTAMPWGNRMFDVVVFDPPYKLNGTPDPEIDGRYGVDQPTRWQDRHDLIARGITEQVRVLKPRGRLLLKCQDQVCSGKVRWQTDEFTRVAEDAGCRKVDALWMLGHRPQPDGRRQVHARRNGSALLVFEVAA